MNIRPPVPRTAISLDRALSPKLGVRIEALIVRILAFWDRHWGPPSDLQQSRTLNPGPHHRSQGQEIAISHLCAEQLGPHDTNWPGRILITAYRSSSEAPFYQGHGSANLMRLQVPGAQQWVGVERLRVDGAQGLEQQFRFRVYRV